MNKQGQSIVEYSLIAILVVLGILFMGPYVLRSIDAHFKLWDEGTQDSFEENLKQASLNSIPFMNSDCQCTQHTQNCGGPGALCPANEREIDWTCTPYQGCNGAAGTSTCSSPDPSCCGCPDTAGCGAADTSTEGTNPLSTVTCPTETSSGESCTSQQGSIPSTTPSGSCYCPIGSTASPSNCPAGTAAGVSCCSTPSITTGSPCYYGYRIYNYQCGSATPSICVKDDTCPLPTCTGSIAYPGSTLYCAGSLAAASASLTSNTQNSYVDQSVCGTANQPACAVYCVAPYVANVTTSTGATGTGASQCILHFVVASNDCSYANPSTTCHPSTCALSNPVFDPADDSRSCTCSSSCQIPPGSPWCASAGGAYGEYACTTIVNNESFTACSSGLPIASVTESASFPVAGTSLGIHLTNGNVCGNPGMPGDGCNIDVTWGNNN